MENNKELYAPKDEVFNQTCFALLDCLWENRAEVMRHLAVATMAGGMAVLFGGAAYRMLPQAKPSQTECVRPIHMLSPEIERAISEAGAQFCRQFTVGSRREAHEIAAAFRRAIYQGRPGRPPREEITEAIRRLDSGMKRWQVYKELGKETQEERRALTEGIRMRRHRQGRRRRALQNG